MDFQSTTPFNPCSRNAEIEVTRRLLPHWEQAGGCYFVTFRLGDSLPQTLIAEIRMKKERWLKAHTGTRSAIENQDYQRRLTRQAEIWLDAGYGECFLRNSQVREAVISSITKFDRIRYELDSFVVMPNHVHLILQMRDSFALGKELRAMKGASARNANKVLCRSGNFWMSESYDRLIRNKDELVKFRNYIENNPTKAGLSKSDFELQMNQRLVCY